MINENGTFIEDADIPDFNPALFDEKPATNTSTKPEIKQIGSGEGTLEAPFEDVANVVYSTKPTQIDISSPGTMVPTEMSAVVNYSNALGTYNKFKRDFLDYDYKQLENVAEDYGLKSIAMHKDFGVLAQRQDGKWYKTHLRIKNSGGIMDLIQGSTTPEEKWEKFKQTGNAELEADFLNEIPGFIPEALMTTGVEVGSSLLKTAIAGGTPVPGAAPAVAAVEAAKWGRRLAKLGKFVANGAYLASEKAISGAAGKIVGDQIKEAMTSKMAGQKEYSMDQSNRAFQAGAENLVGSSVVGIGVNIFSGIGYVIRAVAKKISGIIPEIEALVKGAPNSARAVGVSDTMSTLDAATRSLDALDSANKASRDASMGSLTSDFNSMEKSIKQQEKELISSLTFIKEENKIAADNFYKITKEKTDKEILDAVAAEKEKAVASLASEDKLGKEALEKDLSKLSQEKKDLTLKEKTIKDETKQKIEQDRISVIKSDSIGSAKAMKEESYYASIQAQASREFGKVEKEMAEPIIINGKPHGSIFSQKMPDDIGYKWDKNDAGVWAVVPDVKGDGTPKLITDTLDEISAKYELGKVDEGASVITETKQKIFKIFNNTKTFFEITNNPGIEPALPGVVDLIRGVRAGGKMSKEETEALTMDLVAGYVNSSIKNADKEAILDAAKKMIDMDDATLEIYSKGGTVESYFKLSKYLKSFGQTSEGISKAAYELGREIDKKIMVDPDIGSAMRKRNSVYAETKTALELSYDKVKNKTVRTLFDIFDNPLKAAEFDSFIDNMEAVLKKHYGEPAIGFKKAKVYIDKAKAASKSAVELDTAMKKELDLFASRKAEIDLLETELKDKVKIAPKEKLSVIDENMKSLEEMLRLNQSKELSSIKYSDKEFKVKIADIKGKTARKIEVEQKILEAKTKRVTELYAKQEESLNLQKKMYEEIGNRVNDKLEAVNNIGKTTGDGFLISNMASLNATRRAMAAGLSLFGGDQNKTIKLLTLSSLKKEAAEAARVLPYSMVKQDATLKVKNQAGAYVDKILVDAKDSVIAYESVFTPKEEAFYGMGSRTQLAKNQIEAMKALGFNGVLDALKPFKKAISKDLQNMKPMNQLIKDMKWNNQMGDPSVDGIGVLMRDYEKVIEDAYGKDAVEKFRRNEWANMQIKGMRNDAIKKFANIIAIRKKIGEWANGAISEYNLIDKSLEALKSGEKYNVVQK